MNELELLQQWNSLTFQNNFIFGKTLETNPDICRRLLEMILHLHIQSIHFPEREKVIENRTDSKGIRLDIFVQDKNANRCFNIEMQVSNSDNISKRMRYYQGLIDMDMLKHGQHYSSLGESFIIFICPFDRFKAGRHIYTFRESCVECPSIKLNDGSTKIFLSTKGTVDDIDSNLKAFLNYVDCGLISGDFVQKLDTAVQLVKSDRKAMKEFMTYEMSLLEREIVGEQRGFLRGRNEEKEDIALKMLLKGTPISDIHDMTGLPLARIQELAKKNPQV